MTTSPSKESLINYERLMRPLQCLDCKVEYQANEPNPICPYCGGQAVVVIKSALTGEVVNTPRKE